MAKDKLTIISEIKPFLEDRYDLTSYESSKNVIIRDKYGLIKSSVSDIKRGYTFTINSAIDKDSYAKSRILDKFPDLDVSMVCGVINGASILTVANKYGLLSYSYNDLVLNRKSNISIKSAINKNQYFTSMCREIHGDDYDYSKIEYINAKTKVTLSCKIHGEFNVQPNHIVNDFSGCPKCGHTRTANFQKQFPSGWGVSSWKNSAKNSKNFDSFKLYIIKAWGNGETFVKVGRTFTPISRRLCNYAFPYNFEVMCELSGSAEEVFDAENAIKRIMKEYKYTPLTKFKGMEECFCFLS